MQNLLQSGVSWAIDQLLDHCAVSATYVAGSTRLSIRAVKSEADVDVIQGDGSILTVRVTDWRVRREDLVQAGAQIKPARGHKIEYQLGSLKQTYEVQPAGGEACFTPIGPQEAGWRIRSKLILEA